MEAKIKTEMEATIVLHSKMSAVTVRGDMIEKFDKKQKLLVKEFLRPLFWNFWNILIHLSSRDGFERPLGKQNIYF